MAEFFQTTYRLDPASGSNLSAERDLQARGSDIINIRDVSGSDDYEKLRNAINYAQNTGNHARTVYLPSGTYELGSAINLPTIDANNIEIRGDGPSTVLEVKKTSGTADTYGTIFAITGTRVRVRDLTINYEVDDGFVTPKLPTFDIDIGSDILIENTGQGTAAPTVAQGRTATFDAPSSGVDLANSDLLATCEGLIQAGADGVLGVRVRSAVAGSTVSVMTSSVMIVSEVK